MSKISELSDGGVIQGGDTLIAVRSGGNVKVTYGGSTTANIDGGTIDGTVIGGSTAAAGTFTSITGTQFSSDATDVELKYSGSTKLATTATGIDVTGTVTADGLTVDGTATVNSNVFEVSSTTPNVRLTETDVTGENTQLLQSGGNFRIRTASDDYGTTTERMRIDHATGDISFYEDTGTTPKFFWDASAERLGIGTTSPSATLTVGTPTGSAVSFVSNPVASFGGGIAFDAGSGNDIQLINYRASNMQLGNRGLVDMTIDSSGNVGIGTSSPAAKLEIGGAGEGIILASPDGTRYEITVANGGTLTVTAV